MGLSIQLSSEEKIKVVYEKSGQRVTYKPGIDIPKKYWDSKKRRVKTSAPDCHLTNKKLNDLEASCIEAVKYFEDNGHFPNAAELKRKISGIATGGKPMYEAFQEYIDLKALRFREAAKNARLTMEKLKEYEDHKKTSLSYNSFDQVFYENFLSYLSSRNYALNTQGKYIKSLRWFLNWAMEQGHHSKAAYKKFKVLQEEVDLVYLEYDELIKLLNKDISDPYLSQIRDQHCFRSATGIRSGDYLKIEPEHFQNNAFSVFTEKTNDRLLIPLNHISRSIAEKYNFHMPKIGQVMENRYIKIICEMAGINSPVSYTRTQGSGRKEFKGPKFKFISTHAAKRTFIVNSLLMGVPIHLVMRIVGNKDYDSMKPYIKIADSHLKEAISNSWDMKKPR